MITVRFDLTNFNTFLQLLSAPDTLGAIAQGVAANARDMWIRAASQSFMTTRREYIAAIHDVELDGTTAHISLYDDNGSVWPALLEEGTAGFDMRNTLLKGADRRVIPIRHSGPDSAGHAGQPMGRDYRMKLGDSAARELGKQIYKQAKQLKKGQRLSGGLAPKLKDAHKSDLYRGMIRTGAKSQSQYITFRTISQDSPSDSWLYPEKSGEHLAEMIAGALPNVIDKIVGPYIQEIAGAL